jgi:hypothetical protein
MAASEYRYPDFVAAVTNDVRVRIPRLQPSAQTALIREASQLVTHGEIVIDDDNTALTQAGQTSQEWIDARVAEGGAYMEVPAVVIDAADTTWTKVDDKGKISLTAQGERHKILKTQLGSDKAATAHMEAEAALYNTKFGSTTPGVKPGEQKVEPDSDTNNPFNPAKKYTSQEARENEIVKYTVRFGTPAARKSAAKYSVDLAGRILRKTTR